MGAGSQTSVGVRGLPAQVNGVSRPLSLGLHRPCAAPDDVCQTSRSSRLGQHRSTRPRLPGVGGGNERPVAQVMTGRVSSSDTAIARLCQNPRCGRTKGQACSNAHTGPVMWGCSEYPQPASARARAMSPRRFPRRTGIRTGAVGVEFAPALQSGFIHRNHLLRGGGCVLRSDFPK
jgi:hypothetical protein